MSYARTDREAVSGVVAALRDRGLRLFLDESGIPGFTSITAELRSAIAGSRLLLAFFSRTYPTRMACRWELDYAIRAGYSEGNPFGRIIVVNPESDMDHIPYQELRVMRQWPAPESRSEERLLADDITDRLSALPAPIGCIEPSGRFSSPPGFTGRDLEIHAVNARLGLSANKRADALSGSPRPRTAFVVGPPGIGKTALIAEYLHRFGEQFGDVHRFDGRVPDGHPEGLVVVDDLAEDQVEAARTWLAHQPTACAALITAHRHLHLPAELLRLGGLDRESTLALLASYRRPESPGEWREAELLADDLGGHPQAARVAGHLAQTFADTPFARARHAWHRRDRDVIGEFARRMGHLEDGAAADFASRIREALPAEGSAELTVLRAITAMPGLADHNDLLAQVLLDFGHAELPGDMIEALDRRGLTVAGRPIPVTSRLIERADPDPVRGHDVVRATRAAYDGRLHTIRRRGRSVNTTTDAEIEIAFRLQIELSTRVATNRLPDGQGLLGEALASLKTVLDAARKSLVELGASGHSGEVAALATKLNEALLPFLTEWHPRLSDHNSTRPDGVGVMAHERAWEQARSLRDELVGVQESLAEILDRLRRVTGSGL